MTDAKELLDQELKHSTELKDVEVDFSLEVLPSGFSAIDDGEYLPRNRGRLVVLAGMPGSGKTAFALQMANVLSKSGRVLFLSFEMSKENLKERLIAGLAKVPLRKLREAPFAPRIKAAEAEISKLNLSIIDNGGLTLAQTLQYCFDEHTREPLSAIIVDYMGLFDVDDANRWKEMGRVAESLKFKLAEKLKIPVIVLSQLNEEFAKRYNQYVIANEKAKFYPDYKPVKTSIRPLDSDLAETKRLGRAADVVMVLHRPFIFNREESPSKAIVYVVKNRHGAASDFELSFAGEVSSFTDMGF